MALADAQTITVHSTTAASASMTTLGTITVYRAATAGADPKAIVVTIKKASTGGGGGGGSDLTVTWTATSGRLGDPGS